MKKKLLSCLLVVMLLLGVRAAARDEPVILTNRSGSTVELALRSIPDGALTVAAYAKDSGKMLGLAMHMVSAEDTQARLTFDAEIPADADLKAFMLDESSRPLIPAVELTGEKPEPEPQKPVPVDPGPDSDSKSLVVCFSATGTTRGIVQKIQTAAGADIFEITPETPYTNADLNYSDSASRSQLEQNDNSARPMIEQTVSNIGDYDVIFLGYPIWNGKAPKVVYTFLESVEGWHEGQTIVPFCTSGSTGIGGSIAPVKSLVNGPAWTEGRRFSSSESQQAVNQWLVDLGLKDGPAETKLNVSFNGHTYTATLEENSAVDEFVAYLRQNSGSIILSASDYGSFEKVAPLGTSLTTANNAQTTTAPGDFVLYSGNQIVLFYGSNSWSYTRLGKLDGDISNLRGHLGSGNVSITFSLTG